MPSRLKKAIGAVKDQTSISLAKVNSSSNLEVTVLKATTHDDIPVDDQYVYEVLRLVSSNKIYAAACARAIRKRITRTRNWIVALKSLNLVLRIFQDGDPYFPREVVHAMKRGAKILNLSNFRDDSNSSMWDYTAFVRTFALYLDERLECFLTGKLQRRYTLRKKDDFHSFRKRINDSVRDMKPSMLLDRIHYWQRLLERAIATRPTGAARDNRLVQLSLYAVVRESLELYKDISDGLALVLDSFSNLKYQSRVSVYQICVNAEKQFEEIDEFYSLCKSIGVGRVSEYPTVEMISGELIGTLKEFLKDKSSSPSNKQTPRKPLVLPVTGLASRRHESYGGLSQFSGFTTSTDRFSDKSSEVDSQCASLEELICATENGKTPSISIDLEAYSDQFEKRSQQEAFRVSKTGSTRSLPVTNSMVDLISLDDWSANEDQKERKNDFFESILVNDLSQTSSANSQLQSTPSKGWELILAESVTPSSQSQGNGFGALTNPQAQNGSIEDWELVLAGTRTHQQPTHPTDILSNTFDAPTALTLFNHPQPINHYNPFLQDIPTVNSCSTSGFGASFPGNDPFSTGTTFQATTPSYWAQNQNNATKDPLNNPFASGSHKEDDPFATDMRSGYIVNAVNLIQQQQLWLQNQNKIIARHMTNV